MRVVMTTEITMVDSSIDRLSAGPKHLDEGFEQVCPGDHPNHLASFHDRQTPDLVVSQQPGRLYQRRIRRHRDYFRGHDLRHRHTVKQIEQLVG
jgi:hypothetical protein